MPIPARPLLLALAVWLLLALGAVFWPALHGVWVGGGVFLGAVAVADALGLRSARRVSVTREVPGRMALGVGADVPLTLNLSGRSSSRVQVWDTLPDSLETSDFPWSGVVPGGGFVTINIRVQPVGRGPAVFGQVHVGQFSRLGFWRRRYLACSPSATRIYPNYEPVVRLALLAMVNGQDRMGLRQLNRPGQSREFRQLRDFQDGDSLAQIDWKTTARRVSLTSREYEEQRNQTLILMIDCGRRLRSMDGKITQFDHSLNALLLLAFIALRRGDHVGVMSFGSENLRWLPPVKGPHAITTVLNHLYDYQPSAAPGDFGEAAENLLTRWQRRALVVIATNLRSEDALHFTAPLALIRQKHLVVVASLKETEIETLSHVPVTDLASALRFSAIQQYLNERRALLEKLHRSGILTVDAPAADLPIALGNLYLSIKKRALL